MVCIYRLEKCSNCHTTEMVAGKEGLMLTLVDGALMCVSCKEDYRLDHPDMEELVAAAEHHQDCLYDR
jgi:hypothetical protein